MFIRITLALTLIVFASQAHAQHSDIELGYDDVNSPTTLIMDGGQISCEELAVFESEMVILDPFNPSDLAADDPGFATNLAESLTINAGDQLWLEVLDASEHSQFGVGYVNYFDPSTNSISAFGQIQILDNSSGTGNLILDGLTLVSGANPQFIDSGSSLGEIHDHVIFDLIDETNSPDGAYGVLFQLHTDVSPADGDPDYSSAPFWIIFNHGMSQSDFDNNALAGFGVIPNATGFVDFDVESYVVTRGTHASGGPSELAASDNVDFVARRNGSDISSRVFVELTTTSATPSPALFEFTLEGAVFARSTVTQTIECFNYDSGAWEVIDLRNASRFTDSTTITPVSGNLTRFIESGTNEMKARLRYESANPRQRFTVNIDQAKWTLKY